MHHVLLCVTGLTVWLCVLGNTASTQWTDFSQNSFTSDVQLTIGLDCLDGKVMYLIKDSISKSATPLQFLNENTFHGKSIQSLSCKNVPGKLPIAFYDTAGNLISANQALLLANENISTGLIPYWFNRKNFF
jgi:hypothetical protein